MADRYWVGGAGSWNSTTKWSATSGGASGASVPTTSDNVFIDSNSGTPGTITATGAANCADLTISVTGWTISLTNNNIQINGSVTLNSGTTWSSTGNINFSGTATRTVTTNGVSIASSITFQGNFTSTLGSNLTTTQTFALNYGTLNLSSYTLTAPQIQFGSLNIKTLNFGTGNVTLTGSGTVWSQINGTSTATGTPVVNLTYSGATACTIDIGNQWSNVAFNITAGTYTLSTPSNNYGSLNFTGFSGSWGLGANHVLYGDLIISSSMTLIAQTGRNLTFDALTSNQTNSITTAGLTLITKDIKFDSTQTGTTFKFIGNSTFNSTAFDLLTGTIDLNGYTLTPTIGFTASGNSTKNLTFNGGTLLLSTGANFSYGGTAFTTTAGTGTGKISFTSSGNKTFGGGGATYNCTLSNDGSGALTIQGSNTFTTIANGVQPTTFTFTSGTTQTFTNFNVSGTAGNLVTIQSSGAAVHTLSKTSGTVSADYLSISRSTATGGATWYAGANSTNGGNNTGWIFTAPPPPSVGNFFLMFGA